MPFLVSNVNTTHPITHTITRAASEKITDRVTAVGNSVLTLPPSSTTTESAHVDAWTQPELLEIRLDGDTTRYVNQIIIQLENEKVIAAIAARLESKHPDAVLIQLDTKGNYRVISGKPKPCKHGEKRRWQVVGHGGSPDPNNPKMNNMIMGERTPEMLAYNLKEFCGAFEDKYGVKIIPDYVSMVGCSVVSKNKRKGFTPQFIRALGGQGIRPDVSARSSVVSVNSKGRKSTENDAGYTKDRLAKVIFRQNPQGKIRIDLAMLGFPVSKVMIPDFVEKIISNDILQLPNKITASFYEKENVIRFYNNKKQNRVNIWLHKNETVAKVTGSRKEDPVSDAQLLKLVEIGVLQPSFLTKIGISPDEIIDFKKTKLQKCRFPLPDVMKPNFVKKVMLRETLKLKNKTTVHFDKESDVIRFTFGTGKDIINIQLKQNLKHLEQFRPQDISVTKITGDAEELPSNELLLKLVNIGILQPSFFDKIGFSLNDLDNSVLIAEWSTWVEAAEPHERCAREEALLKLKKCLKKGGYELDLSYLYFLSSLPEKLPPSLKILRIQNNRITHLPRKLPASLQVFEMQNNRITDIPKHFLPSLEILDMTSNEITGSLENFPPSIKTFRASHNKITGLPESYPPSLEVIEMRHNRIPRLPESLPPSLKIDVSGNPIKYLPEKLSPKLLISLKNQLLLELARNHS